MTLGAVNVITGGVMFVVTFTVRVASASRPPVSFTRKVKVAFDAEQLAATLAVTLPELLIAIFETVTPFSEAELPPLTVTVNAVGGSSLSLTVAICALELAAPFAREMVPLVMVGGVSCTSKA